MDKHCNSNAVGWLIVFFTMLFAVSEAADRLGFDQISGLIDQPTALETLV
jgi:hypothetical protein